MAGEALASPLSVAVKAKWLSFKSLSDEVLHPGAQDKVDLDLQAMWLYICLSRRTSCKTGSKQRIMSDLATKSHS